MIRLKRNRWALEPRYQLLVKPQFNVSLQMRDDLLKDGSRSVDVDGRYQISKVYAARYYNLILNLSTSLFYKYFDVVVKHYPNFRSDFTAIYCIRLKRRYRKYCKHHSIEVIFKPDESIHYDSSTDKHIPTYHEIQICNERAFWILDGMQKMEEFQQHILHGNYSVLKEIQ